MKIQTHHLFKVSFGLTTTCVVIVYENVMKSGRIKAGMGVKIIDYWAFGQFIPLCSLSCRSKLIGCQVQDNFGTFC